MFALTAVTAPPASTEFPAGTSGDAVSVFAYILETLDLKRLGIVAALFVACLVGMKILLKLLDKTLDRVKVERSLHNFIRSIVRILLWFVTIIIIAGYMQVPLTSIIAIISVIGLAISLAIQGTLSNLAGGIMILLSKPFSGGDFIEVGSVSGIVSEIGMVYTKVTTFDNKTIFVPNGQISGEKIINYTREETRRVDLKFCVAYDDSPAQVKACIQEVVGAHGKALFTPAPFIGVSAYKDSSVEYAVRVWCATADYWDLYNDLLEQVKTAFDREGVSMTYNHLNVHLVERNL